MEQSKKYLQNVEEYEQNRKITYYIAGPITGVKDYKNNFANAEEKLKSKGYSVFNPATFPVGMSYNSYIKICKSIIEEVDAVYMLKGWQDSAGASIERVYAESIGKRIEEE